MKTRKLPKPSLTQIKDPALKKWLRDYDQYFLHDEIVYRAPDHNSNLHPQHVILIPSALQDQVLKSLHDGPLGGHLCITRIEERVRNDYIGLAFEKQQPDIFSCAMFAITRIHLLIETQPR